MPTYHKDKVNGDLDNYEDHLKDGYANAEDEDEYVEEEEEDLSEEALKLLKYRQKLKEQLRSKLRKEMGMGGSIITDKCLEPVLKKFGSFFGPSKPVIADRVIQESKALLETPRLVPKASENAKKAHISGGESSKETSNQPLNQVKLKAQILKDIRDYSFLFDDKDIPKLTKDLKEKKSLDPNQDKSHEPLAQSGRLVSNSNEWKKTHVSLNSRRQLDFATQRQPTKQFDNESARPAMPKSLPTKKPLSSDGKNVPDSLEKKQFVGDIKDKVPPASKDFVSNGHKSLVKSRASSVNNNLELKKDPQRRTESNFMKKEYDGACKDQKKLPKRSSTQANAENNLKKQIVDRQNVHKHSRGINNGHSKKERRAGEAFSDDERDYRSIIRNMFGYHPSRYKDIDDDDDDICMEANFDAIRREELRSAKIAKREDEEEFAKILEEERQERLRKKAKMCKVR